MASLAFLEFSFPNCYTVERPNCCTTKHPQLLYNKSSPTVQQVSCATWSWTGLDTHSESCSSQSVRQGLLSVTLSLFYVQWNIFRSRKALFEVNLRWYYWFNQKKNNLMLACLQRKEHLWTEPILRPMQRISLSQRSIRGKLTLILLKQPEEKNYRLACLQWKEHFCAGILEQSMGARNREGIGLLYRPARLHRMAESIPWHWFLGSLKV